MSNAPSEMGSKLQVVDTEPTSTLGKSKKKKDPKSEIIKNLIQIIDGFNHTWGKFPRKFLIVRDKAGNALWLEKNSKDMVWASGLSAVAETLQKYLAENQPKLHFPHHEIKSICELWALQTKAHKLDDIAIVQQKSEKGLCWHRLEFDFADGPCPTWDEILGRMENATAFSAWTGSLFDSRSDRCQYIFLSGSGDNSKGTIIDMFAHIFGKDRGFKSAEPWDKRPGQFWKRMILGSRIVCFPECNDPKFVLTEGFKSLTGDSFHSLDGKFADIFTAELNCKFLIAGNVEAEISGEWAERKRLIPCHMQPIDPEKFMPKGILYPKLIAELPAFCYKAFRLYQKLCPNHDRIPINQKITDELVEKSEEKYQDIFDIYFVPKSDGEILGIDMHRFRTLQDIAKVLHSNNEYGKFVKFLERKGIRRTRTKDRKSTVYVGISKSKTFERLIQTIETESMNGIARDIEPEDERKIDKALKKGESGILDWAAGPEDIQ